MRTPSCIATLTSPVLRLESTEGSPSQRTLTSPRVLATEWIDGTPPRSLPDAERQALARTAVRCLAMQLMSDGFIHCDPHEGNLLGLPDGRVALLDFGLMAQMRRDHQEAMASGVLNIMAALTRSADDVRMKQAMKRAEKDRVTRIEQDRRARERQFMLGDRYSVMASRADYADASSDPDARQWVDLVFHEIMQRPLPDQYELRRDVWRVHVVQLDGGTLGAVVGGDCTQTADPAEIASVAEQLIARFEGRA